MSSEVMPKLFQALFRVFVKGQYIIRIIKQIVRWGMKRDCTVHV